MKSVYEFTLPVKWDDQSDSGIRAKYKSGEAIHLVTNSENVPKIVQDVNAVRSLLHVSETYQGLHIDNELLEAEGGLGYQRIEIKLSGSILITLVDGREANLEQIAINSGMDLFRFAERHKLNRDEFRIYQGYILHWTGFRY